MNRYWETMVGSGHAYLALREDYRQQLKDVVQNLGFKYIRFHGIFDENIGIYTEDEQGHARYNFIQSDMIYDFLLENGIRPCVEFGYMPEDLKSAEKYHFRWRYRVNVSPPKDYKKWYDLIHAFVSHYVERYGLEEVRSWYFEVWNEYDLPQFWSGTSAEYLRLYESTALAVKAVDKNLRVGGPAVTSNGDSNARHFLSFVKDNDIPIDFYSYHAYCASWFLDGDGTQKRCFLEYDKWLSLLKKGRKMLVEYGMEHLPIYITEWNSTPSSRDFSHDVPFIAPFICQSIKDGYGCCEGFSYWTFSDVFEERGPGNAEFHGGFGLITLRGIHKPSYSAYKMLHMLGDKLLYIGDEPVIAAKDENNSLQILAWNYIHPDTDIELNDGTEPQFSMQSRKKIELVVDNISGQYLIRRFRLDSKKGNAYDAWKGMGKQKSLKSHQVETLKSSMDMVLLEERKIRIKGKVDIEMALEPHAVELIMFICEE